LNQFLEENGDEPKIPPKVIDDIDLDY
jgi:hypothetical protein